MNDEQKTNQVPFDAAKARDVIEADQKARAEKCGKMIEAAAIECNCDVFAAPYLDSEGRTKANIQVKAR